MTRRAEDAPVAVAVGRSDQSRRRLANFGRCISAIIALSAAACANENGEPEKSANKSSAQLPQLAAGITMNSERVEYVSRTPNALRYVRPPRDPAIVWKNIEPGYALVDTETGDYFIAQTTDRERRLGDYRFTTKDGKLVCIFMVQDGGGSYAKMWKQYPIRVWHVEESKRQTPDIVAARKRISIPRFAEFLSAHPDWADRPSSQYVVIDAPVSAGDPL